jgi:hypothetical protein
MVQVLGRENVVIEDRKGGMREGSDEYDETNPVW